MLGVRLIVDIEGPRLVASDGPDGPSSPTTCPRWKPSALEGVKKAQAPTALADVHESIDELLHHRQTLLAV